MSDSIDQVQVDYILEELKSKTQTGYSVEAAVAQLLRAPWGTPPEAELNTAIDKFRHQAKVIVEYDTAESFTREHETGDWYTGPENHHIFWPHLKKGLLEKIGDEKAVDEVDEASSKVVASLRPSGTSKFDTKGLVLGYVQSGKTTNFLSVMAKAADVGYRFFIVLTGITESLRKQTQERINSQLIPDNQNSASNPSWYRLTDAQNDFKGTQSATQQNAAALLGKTEFRVLAVVKKNVSVLKKLNDFIASAGIHADNCPILIIDDEADQASISVSKDPDSDPSAINKQIRKILSNRKTAYVAYTATPFANILVNPNTHDDIFPSDFIHVLPKPKGYFGTEDIFGVNSPYGEDFIESDGLDMIRRIPEDEKDALRPPAKKNGKTPDWDPYIPSSLTAAVRWFVMATAARRAREDNAHCSMLIHTAMLTDAHYETQKLLKPVINRLKLDFRGNPEPWISQWEAESSAVEASLFDNPSHAFDEISGFIPQVFDDLKIIVDNSKSDERLEYSDSEPSTVIVIGANTLSRGLTLEGLICSYFVRNATAYDTLLQMGRWFGFRNGYQDLPRIWLTEDLETWFEKLSLVELDMRQDFSMYERERITPRDFLPLIRLTPGIDVTNRAKQQNITTANVSFNRQRIQTILFNHQDRDWLQHNIDATKRLTQSLGDVKCPHTNKSNGTVVFHHVPNENILEFLRDYKIQEDAILGKHSSQALIDYIEKERDSGSILEWSISFFGKTPSKNADDTKTIDLGLPNPLPLVTRSQMRNSKAKIANIKSLVGSNDRLNDIDLNSAERKAIEKKIDEDGRKREAILVQAHENFMGPNVGHLAIYAIDKDSQASAKKTKTGEPPVRKDLNAVEHIIGFGIFFPKSNRPKGSVEYACVIDIEEDTRERIRDAQEEDIHAVYED